MVARTGFERYTNFLDNEVAKRWDNLTRLPSSIVNPLQATVSALGLTCLAILAAGENSRLNRRAFAKFSEASNILSRPYATAIKVFNPSASFPQNRTDSMVDKIRSKFQNVMQDASRSEPTFKKLNQYLVVVGQVLATSVQVVFEAIIYGIPSVLLSLITLGNYRALNQGVVDYLNPIALIEVVALGAIMVVNPKADFRFPVYY